MSNKSENPGALISVMARSTTRSNQRPDTLMQDRKADRSDLNLLRRTAGPYIGVNNGCGGSSSTGTSVVPQIS
jgi:hypothetical protein